MRQRGAEGWGVDPRPNSLSLAADKSYIFDCERALAYRVDERGIGWAIRRCGWQQDHEEDEGEECNDQASEQASEEPMATYEGVPRGPINISRRDELSVPA
jgi:hypothetical protein